MRRRPRAGSFWFTATVGFAAMMLPTAYLAAVAMAEPFLWEPAAPASVDTIVVLGGDGPARARKAAELWKARIADNVVVTGAGDCTYIRDDLVEAGVRRDAITIECLSQSTWQNARFAAPLLEATGTRSALLVTSWYHTARAMTVFRAFCPGIDWRAASPEPPPPVLTIAFGRYGPSVAKEYVKAAGYWLRGAIFPPDVPSPGTACFLGGERA